MRLVKDQYKIKLENKRPGQSRVTIRNYTKENIDELCDTKVYNAVGGVEMKNLSSVRAMKYNEVQKKIGNNNILHLRDTGTLPDGWELAMITEHSDHGGIPLGDGKFAMDFIILMKNKNEGNLRHHDASIFGSGNSKYKHNTILNESISEDKLVCIDLPVLVQDNEDDEDDDFLPELPKSHEFYFATCIGILVSLQIWRVISDVFEPVNFYLVMPNVNTLLTQKDLNKYVVKMCSHPEYKPWNEEVVNLQQDAIKNFVEPYSPLGIDIFYKIVSIEKVGDKTVVFFTAVTADEKIRKDKKHSWAMYDISNVYTRYRNKCQICIAALAAVCDDGIGPVKIQRDPPVQGSIQKGELVYGSAKLSISNHKYTFSTIKSNCNYRVGGEDDDEEEDGPLSFPGNLEVSSKDQVLMAELSEVDLKVKDLCIKAFQVGKGNLVENYLRELKNSVHNLQNGISKSENVLENDDLGKVQAK